MRVLKIDQSMTRRDEHSLNRYLVELDRTELLAVGEEYILAEKVRSGDQAATERLIKANLRFVVSVAKKYQHLGLPLADLVSEGNLGLIRAATLFDPSKGFKFISYAVWWIRQGITSALGNQARMIRLPGNMVNDTARVRKVAQELEQKLEREPSSHELSEVLAMASSDPALSYAFGKTVVSLDSPARADGDGDLELGSVIVDQSLDSPDAPLLAESLRVDTLRLLAVLSPREREVIRYSFGLGVVEKSVYELSLQLDLSTERVRQIKKQALVKLKGFVAKGSLLHG